MSKLVTFIAYCSHQFHSRVSSRVWIRKTALNGIYHFYVNVRLPSTSSATSQNHRAVEVGGHVWVPSFIHSVSEGLGQLSFEYLKGWRHHNLSEQPSAAFAHLHNLERNRVVCSDWISYISMCAHCLFSHQWALLRKAWFHLPCTCLLPNVTKLENSSKLSADLTIKIRSYS